MNPTGDSDAFYFRDIHYGLFLGTASDRYAGWVGQIYSRDRYESDITRRTKRVGGKDFEEAVLPVASVEEYFQHFGTLELDFTFYMPLRDSTGEPTRVYHLLRTYRRHLREGDRLILKAPQIVFSQNLYRQGSYTRNEDYLKPDVFIHQFYEPATALLDPWLNGIVFEQEYQRSGNRIPLREMAAALEAFFAAVPTDDRYHVELRTTALLARPIFDVLEKYGVGQVLSHWTWLPPLSKQFALCGRKFLNRNGAVIRLMTPRGMRYEDAYARAHPFHALVEGMQSPDMVPDTAALIRAAIGAKVPVHVIVNNRAGGNAPLLAQQIASGFVSTPAASG